MKKERPQVKKKINPIPGSPEAIKMGCTCPEREIGCGGRPVVPGIIHKDIKCPIHGKEPPSDL